MVLASLFSNFASFVQSCVADIANLIKRVTTADTLRRLAGAYKLVSSADGTESEAEMTKFVQVVTRSNSHFTEEDVRKAVNDARARDKFDILQDIGNSGDDEADLIVRCAVAIGGADGNFDETEKKVVAEICAACFIAPSKYGIA